MRVPRSPSPTTTTWSDIACSGLPRSSSRWVRTTPSTTTPVTHGMTATLTIVRATCVALTTGFAPRSGSLPAREGSTASYRAPAHDEPVASLMVAAPMSTTTSSTPAASSRFHPDAIARVRRYSPTRRRRCGSTSSSSGSRSALISGRTSSSSASARRTLGVRWARSSPLGSVWTVPSWSVANRTRRVGRDVSSSDTATRRRCCTGRRMRRRSAAPTISGAANADDDRTVQWSRSRCRPRDSSKIRTTTCSPGQVSRSRSARATLPPSSWSTSAAAAARPAPAAARDSSSMRSVSRRSTPSRTSISWPYRELRSGTRTVTVPPKRVLSALVRR